MTRSAPVACIRLGRSANMRLEIRGETAEAIGVPLVELTGHEYLRHLTPDQADEIAIGLAMAARMARGEKLPTALDEFLVKRRPTETR